MHKVEQVIEARGLAKEQVFHTLLQFDILNTLEPNQLNDMASVRERSAQTRPLPRTDGVPLGYFADDLDIGIFIFYLGYFIEAAAVNILVRILPQHIQRRGYPQLFTKSVGTIRTDTLAICYVSLREQQILN